MKNPQQQEAEMTHPKQRSGNLWALRIFTVAAFAANMVVNYLGTLGYFGETNAEVSNKYPTLLTPAPWAFAIWALIFSLQGVYSIYGLLPGDDDKLRYVVLLNVFVPIGWIGEAVWTIIFNHELIPLSVLFITGSTFFFMTAYLRVTDPADSLEIGETATDLLSGCDPASDAPLLLKKAFYYLIFVAATALNFGWLVVASIVNGLIVLDYLRVDVPVAAAVGLLVFANAVAVLFLAWRRETVVSLVQVWAITAIAAKQTDPTLRAVCYGSVGVLAVLVGITLLAQTVSLVRDRSRQLHRQASSGAYQMTDIFYSARQH